MLKEALQAPWTAAYAKLVAVALFYGAAVHVSNIVGLTGEPWSSTPLLWRVMDVILLSFDVIAAIGLWCKAFWSVWLVFGGITLFQVVPYTLFRSQFVLTPADAQSLNGLLLTESLLLGIFATLIWRRK